MKNPKKPTVKQREIIENADRRYKSDMWLVIKDTPKEMIILNRKSKKQKTIIK